MKPDRRPQLTALIARYDQLGPPEAVDYLPIQLGLAELQQRATPYAMPRGRDLGRPWLEGICVVRDPKHGLVAWVSNGVRVVRFFVMDDVPIGLHEPDAGMVCAIHDYPDIPKALPDINRDRFPVHVFALRALAEMAIESVTTPKGLPLVKIVFAADRGGTFMGQACIKTGNRLPEPVCAPIRSLVTADVALVGTTDAALYDAALVLEATRGARGALFMSIPRSRWDPLVIERADGILHVIAPQAFEKSK